MEPSPLARPPREAVAPCALRLMETGGQTAREALPAHFTRRWERASLAERFRAGEPTLGWPACLFPSPGIVSPNASHPISRGGDARYRPDYEPLEITLPGDRP